VTDGTETLPPANSPGTQIAARTAATMTRPMTQGQIGVLGRSVGAGAGAGGASRRTVAERARARRSSSAEAGRCSGCLPIALRMVRSSGAGRSGRNLRGGSGAAPTCFCATTRALGPSNGTQPTAIA